MNLLRMQLRYKFSKGKSMNEQDETYSLTPQTLDWPRISADNTELANELSKRGYHLEHHGRSGFAARNRYEIIDPEGMSPEALQKIEQTINEIKAAKQLERYAAIDTYFDENSPDANKVYAIVDTDGEYAQQREVDPQKYEDAFYSELRSADHRRNLTHQRTRLLINKERMQQDTRRFITFYVPKDMIGKVIGRGGSNIKALSRKYHKQFKIEQDPRELQQEMVQSVKDQFSTLLQTQGIDGLASFDLTLANTEFSPSVKQELQAYFTSTLEYHQAKQEELLRRQQEQQEREAQERRNQELLDITSQTAKSFADLKQCSAQDLKTGLETYLYENLEKITVLPNEEEQKQILANLQLQKQQAVEKHNREIKAKIEQMQQTAREYLGQSLPTAEEIKAKTAELFKDDPEAAPHLNLVNLTLQKEIDKKRREPELMKQIYYEVIANEITNVNGEIIRSAGSSKGSARRVYSNIYDKMKEKGIENWHEKQFDNEPLQEDESIHQHNMAYIENNFVLPDIYENGGIYQRGKCHYSNKPRQPISYYEDSYEDYYKEPETTPEIKEQPEIVNDVLDNTPPSTDSLQALQAMFGAKKKKR